MPALIHRSLLLIALTTLLPAPAFAQEDPNAWARAMFDSLEHDFGIVAKGSETTHRFKVTNKYKETMQIQSVVPSCGCTSPQFDQNPVKSLDSTEIVISMDTNRFQGSKSSTVTVTFSQPKYAVVAIPVKVFIRSDVVLTPGSINFGNVDKGTQQDRKIDIAYAYQEGFAGDPNWKIKGVTSNTKSLKGEVKERARGNGRVDYDLNVSLLPDATVGTLREQLFLETTDEANPRIPLQVTARVEPDIMVTPSVLQLGSVAPGVTSTYPIVIKGKKAFVIDKVERESSQQAFKMPALNKASNIVHVLPLTFTAPMTPGAFSEKFTVTIKDRPEPIEFTARGTIVQTAQK